MEQDSFGKIIRGYRERKHKSLRQLENQTGISFSHLSKIERGEYKPPREKLIAISSALAIPEEETNKILLSAEYAPLNNQEANKQDTHESHVNISEFLEILKTKSIDEIVDQYCHTYKEGGLKPDVVREILDYALYKMEKENK